MFALLTLKGILPTPGMSVRVFWAMIAMHLLSAALAAALLPTAFVRK